MTSLGIRLLIDVAPVAAGTYTIKNLGDGRQSSATVQPARRPHAGGAMDVCDPDRAKPKAWLRHPVVPSRPLVARDSSRTPAALVDGNSCAVGWQTSRALIRVQDL
jgi:hypothetical protein